MAGAWNLIGSGYLKAGRFEDASEATEKAILMYGAIEANSAKGEQALARGQLGYIFEELRQMANAREIRLQGAREGRMVCTCMVVG